jgi:hypothetical protein
LSHGVFGPKNFTNISKHTTVTGVFFDPFKLKRRQKESTDILISGKLTKEHGIELLQELLRKYSLELERLGVCFVVVGYSADNVEFFEEYNILKFSGFVSDEEYSTLLSSNLFAMVLQDPEGRFHGEKVPSKLYRYLDKSMRVLSTRFDKELVGELENLVDYFSSTEELFELIRNYSKLADNKVSIEAKKNRMRFEAVNVGKNLSKIIYE